MSAATPCVAADGYGFSYADSGRRQLDGLTFQVAAGERVAVMGATGAGKTTLMASLNGLIPHHIEGDATGELRICGRPVGSSRISDLVRDVGLVMQDAEAQITGTTALEDATIGPANLGLPRDEVMARARAALRTVGLEGLEGRATSQLSGGQQQRLAMAGVLAMRPRILALDEPTSELDPAGARDVIDVIDRLSRDAGTTVLMATHDGELACQWADRLLVLQSGRLAYDGPPTAFLADAARVAKAGLRQPDGPAVVHALRANGLLTGGDGGPVAGCGATLETVARFLEPRLPARARGRAATPRPAPQAPDQVSEGSLAGPPPALSICDLRYVYPSGVAALDGISLQVRRGEFVALLGRNGAGKSTFARCLDGLLRPASGTVTVLGRPTAGRPVHELAGQVGYVFQNPDHQIFSATVFDEIAFGLRNRGAGEEQVRGVVERVAGQVGLGGRLDVHPLRLGKGERQRLAVAGVLALEPEILVLDEPTTGQDWPGSVAVMDLARRLNEAGRTILMITHDMAVAARYARRAVVFDEGRLIADGDMTSLFADQELLERAGLRAPQVSLLARRLGMPTVTTVEDFVAAWEDVR